MLTQLPQLLPQTGLVPEWLHVVFLLVTACSILYVYVKSRAFDALKSEVSATRGELDVMKGKVTRQEQELSKQEQQIAKMVEHVDDCEGRLDRMQKRLLTAYGEIEDIRKEHRENTGSREH